MEWYGCHIDQPKRILQDSPLTAIAWMVGNPQRWTMAKPKPKVEQRIIADMKSHPNLSMEQVVIHACFLINLANKDMEQLEKSRKRIREELRACERLGITKIVLHPGVADPNDTERNQRVIEELKQVFEDVPGKCCILIENMTGGRKLCTTLEECKEIVDSHERLKFCLDTAHAWGEGWNMSTIIDDTIRIITMEKLGAIHLNDSKVAHGERVDRHQCLFKGRLDPKDLQKIMKDERLKRVPAILETPLNCHPVMKAYLERGEIVAPVQWCSKHDEDQAKCIARSEKKALTSKNKSTKRKRTSTPSQPKNTSKKKKIGEESMPK